MEMLANVFGVQKADPTVMEAARKIHEGVGVLYSAGKSYAWKLTKITGLERAFNLEKSAEQVSETARCYSDTVFLALNIYCFWQNWVIFLIGTAAGMAISEKGLFDDGLQLLQSKQAVAEYNFGVMVLWFLVSQPVHTFTQGLLFGNRLGCPQIPNHPKQESVMALVLHKFADLFS